MIAATVALLFAAVGRMQFITSPPLAAVVWLSPLIVRYGTRLGSPSQPFTHVYIVATVVLFIGATRILFEQSDLLAVPISRPIIDALL